MTHILIDLEIINAIILSITFVGIIISIISMGIHFFVYKLSKQKREEILKLIFLIIAWTILISLVNIFNQDHLQYQNLLINLFGIIIVAFWWFMFPKFLKIFDKKLLISLEVIVLISILEKLIFQFFKGIYFELLLSITMVIPPILGIFMIIKYYIKGKK